MAEHAPNSRRSLSAKSTRYHSWDVTAQEAMVIQKELSAKVITSDRFGSIRSVAGVDVGFEEDGRITRAAVAVLAFPGLELIEVATARCRTSFPYVPGLLSFRELPAVLEAIESLQHTVDLYLCDGQGYAHPRRFGIACHLGVLIDRPAIGVGKKRLTGTETMPGSSRGDWQPLMDGEEIIGAILRTRSNVKPVYVSVGHRISLLSAVDYVLRCTGRFKLPETTRIAHRHASAS